VLIALLAWLLLETQGGDELGLAERLTTAVQTSWPFVVALAPQRTTTPRLWPRGPAAQATRDVWVQQGFRRMPQQNGH
jgi:hypothetical protein